MADRLVITIDGDSTGLNKALSSAETRLNTFNTKVTNSSRGMNRFMASMQGLSKSFASMQASANNAANSMNRAAAAANHFQGNVGRVSTSAMRARSSIGALNFGMRDLILTIYSVRTLMFTGSAIFGGALTSVIKINAEYEKQKILLENISRAKTPEGKKADAAVYNDYIWKMADKVPYDLAAIQDAFVKLKVAGIDPMDGSLQTVVDSMAAFGKDSNSLKLAILGISQMASKGVVSMQELRQQLGEQAPTALRAMAAGMGYIKDINDDNTAGLMKFFKAVETGTMQSSTAIPKMLAVLQKEYSGSAARMTDTWDGTMNRLSNSYKKMIIRLTESSGSNSLFESLKRQANQLENFLNSKEGDQFAKNIQDGLSKLITMVSKTIQWVWKYRDAILMAAEVAIKWFIFGKIATIIGSFGLSVFQATRFIIAMKNAQDGAAQVAMLFGTRARDTAVAMGLINASGQISLGVLGGYALRLGIVAAAIGVVIGALYLYKKQTEGTYQSTSELSSKNVEGAAALQRFRGELDAAALAQQATGNAADGLAQRLDYARRYADSTGIALRKMGIEAEWAAFKLAGVQLQQALADRRQAMATRMSQDTLPFGMGRVVRSVMGDPMEAANKNLGEATRDAQAAYRALMMGRMGLNKPREPAYTSTPVESSTVGDGKKDKNNSSKSDPLGDLNSTRSSVVSSIMAVKQLEAQLADDGKNNALEIHNDKLEQIQEEVEAQVKLITSQEELNNVLRHNKSMLPGLRQDVRTHNKEISQSADLTSELTQQQLKTRQSLGELDDAYNSVEDETNRYVNALQEQHKEALKSEDDTIRQAALLNISNAGLAKRQELLNKESKGSKDAAQEIIDSLLDQDTLRENNYKREMERLRNLLTMADMTPGSEKARSNILRYQDALTKKFNIDKDPFAKWAAGIRPIGASIKESLVGSMDSFIDSLAEGKLSFKSFAKAILQDIAKIIIRAMIARAIMAAFGPTNPVNKATSPEFTAAFADFDAPTSHSGGMVGREHGPSKRVNASMFAFAKRFHGGGMVGLDSSEVPIIAQKGEGVFTPEQMRALGSKGGDTMAPPQINIINQSGSPIEKSQSQPRFDGEKFVVDVLLRHASKPGPVRELFGK